MQQHFYYSTENTQYLSWGFLHSLVSRYCLSLVASVNHQPSCKPPRGVKFSTFGVWTAAELLNVSLSLDHLKAGVCRPWTRTQPPELIIGNHCFAGKLSSSSKLSCWCLTAGLLQQMPKTVSICPLVAQSQYYTLGCKSNNNTGLSIQRGHTHTRTHRWTPLICHGFQMAVVR